MLKDLRDGVKEAIFFIWLALRALKFWRQEPPILTPNDLAGFVETRAKYVAQRTLFGYVKTRAGTRYTSLFEDEIFVASVDAAKWEIYLACLADLAIYAAAAIGRTGAFGKPVLDGLARDCFLAGLVVDELPDRRAEGFGQDRDAFDRRLAETRWAEIPEGEAVFENSLKALVHWAPVADELKQYDVVPVRNSMRFQWKTVRDQLKSLLDADAVAAGLPPSPD